MDVQNCSHRENRKVRRASWMVSIVACVLAVVVACTKRSPNLSAPSAAANPGVAEVNADGSTLKATVPTLQSPINGVRLPPRQPGPLAPTKSTTPLTKPVTFSYPFAVNTTARAGVEIAPPLP